MKKESDVTGLFLFLFMLPLLLVASVFLGLARWFAHQSLPYRLVKFTAFPASLLVTNIAGMLLLIAVTFLATIVSGDKSYFQFAMGNIADLTLFPIWGPMVSTFWDFGVDNFNLKIPVLTVIIYQLLLHWLIGRRFTRQLALAIQDYTLARKSLEIGEDPLWFRRQFANSDAGYTKDSVLYESKGKPPLFGLVSVAWAGVHPNKFYWG